MTSPDWDPDWVVAPGETLRGWFDEMGLPLTVGAHYGLSERTLTRLFRGTQKISPAIAQKLCNLTHIGAPFWLALEHNFRVGLAAGKNWDAVAEGHWSQTSGPEWRESSGGYGNY